MVAGGCYQNEKCKVHAFFGLSVQHCERTCVVCILSHGKGYLHNCKLLPFHVIFGMSYAPLL